MYAMRDLSLPKPPKGAIVASQFAGNPGNVGLKRYAGEFDNGRNAVKYIKLLLLAAQNASWV
jgi:hypothetical protein